MIYATKKWPYLYHIQLGNSVFLHTHGQRNTVLLHQHLALFTAFFFSGPQTDFLLYFPIQTVFLTAHQRCLLFCCFFSHFGLIRILFTSAQFLFCLSPPNHILLIDWAGNNLLTIWSIQGFFSYWSFLFSHVLECSKFTGPLKPLYTNPKQLYKYS